MASNLVVARGGVEYVPPISLAFWRWTLVFLILLPFTYVSLKKNFKVMKKEYKKLFFLGATGCGVCGAFPFLAGQTTTVTNMGIIYTSSPIFIILISSIFFNSTLIFSKSKQEDTKFLFILQVPLEYDLLRDMSPTLLRNRLVLLHHFSDIFCPGIAMFPLGFSVSSHSFILCKLCR